jgi:hypothetical protein
MTHRDRHQERRMEMDEQTRQTAFMSALVTEHFVLQSAASTTVSEAAARASLYVFSLSSALVAMGFTADTPVFAPFVGTVLPALFVLGWFTVVRLVDTTVENSRFLRAVARIRAYYRTLTPEAAGYFAPWQVTEDAAAEALAMLGTRPGRATVLFTTASMVAAINGLVGGVGVALLAAEMTSWSNDAVAIALGCLAALACIGVAYAYQVRRYSAAAAADARRGASRAA